MGSAEEVELSLLEHSEKLVVCSTVEDVEHYGGGLLVDRVDVVLEVDYVGVEEGGKLEIPILVY